jgi:hypothetical protein
MDENLMRDPDYGREDLIFDLANLVPPAERDVK